MVRYDHTKADWTFYKDGAIPVLEVGWNKDFESEAADLTYTYYRTRSKGEWELYHVGIYSR